MSDASNWRPQTNAFDYFLHQSKTQKVDGRRPVIRKPSDLVGPGIAANAIRITDFSDLLATYNGFFSAEPGAASAPNEDDTFVGSVVADSDLGGWQQFRSLNTGYTYERTFLRHPLDAATIYWGSWTSNAPGAASALYWNEFRRTTDQWIDTADTYTVGWESRVEYDGYQNFPYSGSNITIPGDGFYILAADANFAPWGTQRGAVRIVLNGVALNAGTTLLPMSAGNTNAMQAVQARPFDEGDTVGVSVSSYANEADLTAAYLQIAGPFALPAA